MPLCWPDAYAPPAAPRYTIATPPRWDYTPCYTRVTAPLRYRSLPTYGVHVTAHIPGFAAARLPRAKHIPFCVSLNATRLHLRVCVYDVTTVYTATPLHAYPTPDVPARLWVWFKHPTTRHCMPFWVANSRLPLRWTVAFILRFTPGRFGQTHTTCNALPHRFATTKRHLPHHVLHGYIHGTRYHTRY